MKKNLLLILVVILPNCSPVDFTENDKLIELIDSAAITEVRYKIEIDSLGIDKDTVQIRSIKLNENDEKIYQELTYWIDERKYLNKEYFRQHTGLFFERTKSDDGFVDQTYKTHLKTKDEIDSATLETKFENENPNLTTMKYDYKRNKVGKKSKLIIESLIDTTSSKSAIFFDDNENITKQINFLDQFEKDTIDVTDYLFLKNKIKKYTYQKIFGRKIYIERNYNDQEQIIYESRKFYIPNDDSIKQNWIHKFYYNEDHLLVSSTETDSLNNVFKKYRYVYPN